MKKILLTTLAAACLAASANAIQIFEAHIEGYLTLNSFDPADPVPSHREVTSWELFIRVAAPNDSVKSFGDMFSGTLQYFRATLNDGTFADSSDPALWMGFGSDAGRMQIWTRPPQDFFWMGMFEVYPDSAAFRWRWIGQARGQPERYDSYEYTETHRFREEIKLVPDAGPGAALAGLGLLSLLMVRRIRSLG